MPNHVAHLLTVKGPKAELDRLIEYVKSDRSAFSFQRIVPMPEALENTVAGFVANETEEQVLARLEEKRLLIQSYGAANWYDWHCRHWGTKWDAYDGPTYDYSEAEKARRQAISSYEAFEAYCQREETAEDYAPHDWWEWQSDEEISGTFSTAWSPATPVYEKLAERFPRLRFKYVYADEGGGFVHDQLYEDGEQVAFGEYDWDSDAGIEIRRAVGYYHDEDEEQDEEELAAYAISSSVNVASGSPPATDAQFFLATEALAIGSASSPSVESIVISALFTGDVVVPGERDAADEDSEDELEGWRG